MFHQNRSIDLQSNKSSQVQDAQVFIDNGYLRKKIQHVDADLLKDLQERVAPEFKT